MCGRYASSRRDADLVVDLDVDTVIGAAPPPSWNVAPTQDARVVVERPGGAAGRRVRQLRTLRWGLVPSWAEDASIGARLINARAETVTSKPAFSRAASRRRCLVPADGYYEWERHRGSKDTVPHFLYQQGAPLWLAGLYEFWADPGRARDHPDRWVATFTIVTTTAADSLGHIHGRAPLIVPQHLRDAWLDPSLTDLGEVELLIASVPTADLAAYEVTDAVNNHRNNGPGLARQAT